MLGVKKRAFFPGLDERRILKIPPPQMPGKDMQSIYALFAAAVISCESGK
jgi:hypothetical protein